MQKTSFIRQNVFPILAAIIWGTAFVAQSVSTEFVQPFTFNAARFAIAFVFTLGLAVLFRIRRKRDFGEQAKPRPHYRRELFLSGLCCGAALTLGNNLQQRGLESTTSGKAGFITALYIVIVPILGIFLKKKVGKGVWASVALAVVGLYFLCIRDGFTISEGDFFMFLCSLCFSAHILMIDHFTEKVDGVELSCAQFLVAAVLSSVGMLAAEQPSWEALQACVWPILYVGIFSSGVAYTLQILAQRDSNPTVVSLLLSLEAVFAVLAGAVLLGDRMSGREYFGCGLMLIAVVLAQIPWGTKNDLTCGEAR
ncbi:DMT family transporter [Oscillibacter sp.]|uniref:DMT family transporter n=1 Tax=Oscillibacter sp. TaxID=1945593 RepID=UPI0028AE7A98|nr:DMT family transporter [Oscillibacter sp.]